MADKAGYLDFCHEDALGGWAMWHGKPARLKLSRVGEGETDVLCNIPREGLLKHGYPLESGFFHRFRKPLATGDVVEVRFPDGDHLAGSPFQFGAERLVRLLHGITPKQVGLEIGALNKPTLRRPDHMVYYVDHASTADLKSKYSGFTDKEKERIVPVDYVWSGGDLLDVVAEDAPFDYCLNSHVIEHIADPISWLNQLSSVLRPGGRLNLAIPERSRTFDHLRSLSTPTQVLEAHYRKIERPSFGQVFDHIAFVCVPGETPPGMTRLREAWEVADVVCRDGIYADVHCHVWTHDSFLELWRIVEHLGLSPLRLDYSYDASPDGYEFYISFERP